MARFTKGKFYGTPRAGNAAAAVQLRESLQHVISAARRDALGMGQYASMPKHRSATDRARLKAGEVSTLESHLLSMFPPPKGRAAAGEVSLNTHRPAPPTRVRHRTRISSFINVSILCHLKRGQRTTLKSHPLSMFPPFATESCSKRQRWKSHPLSMFSSEATMLIDRGHRTHSHPVPHRHPSARNLQPATRFPALSPGGENDLK